MKTSAKKWGNSIAVRIPKPFVKEAGIVNGMELEITIVNKKLVLTQPKQTLSDLLSAITPQSIHKETDTGTPHGKELW